MDQIARLACLPAGGDDALAGDPLAPALISRLVILPELRRALAVWDVLREGVREAAEPADVGWGYDGFSLCGLRGALTPKDMRIARKVHRPTALDLGLSAAPADPAWALPPTRWTSSVNVDILSDDYVCEVAVADLHDTVLGRWRVHIDRQGRCTGSALTVMPYLSLLATQLPFFAALRHCLVSLERMCAGARVLH